MAEQERKKAEEHAILIRLFHRGVWMQNLPTAALSSVSSITRSVEEHMVLSSLFDSREHIVLSSLFESGEHTVLSSLFESGEHTVLSSLFDSGGLNVIPAAAPSSERVWSVGCKVQGVGCRV